MTTTTARTMQEIWEEAYRRLGYSVAARQAAREVLPKMKDERLKQMLGERVPLPLGMTEEQVVERMMAAIRKYTFPVHDSALTAGTPQ